VENQLIREIKESRSSHCVLEEHKYNSISWEMGLREAEWKKVNDELGDKEWPSRARVPVTTR
jgi:hypothetical protein